MLASSVPLENLAEEVTPDLPVPLGLRVLMVQRECWELREKTADSVQMVQKKESKI